MGEGCATLAEPFTQPMVGLRDQMRKYLREWTKFSDMKPFMVDYLDEMLLSSRFSKSREFLEEELSIMKELSCKLDAEREKSATAFEDIEWLYLQTLKELIKMHPTEKSENRCMESDTMVSDGVKYWSPPKDETELKNLLDYIKEREIYLEKHKGREGSKHQIEKNEKELVDPKFTEDQSRVLNQQLELAISKMLQMVSDARVFEGVRSEVKTLINCLEGSLFDLSFADRQATLFKEDDEELFSSASKRDGEEEIEYSTTGLKKQRFCSPPLF
ncbi:hypothetical protein BVC80_6815g3 [Macleaya cordata]|uniref:Uncharacterized protein n=1 Tax=Macleaya cordata TaxID=56857 RepID=A0A200QG56_MACCD|nr:hypothetical protein BVC80_6815g3 [Macleaya cordata]